MKNILKNTIALSVIAVSASASVYATESYVVRVPLKLTLGEWVYDPLINSEWRDISGAYDCGEWTPEPSEIPQGEEFQQVQSCSHDMERTATQYKVNSITGEKLLEFERLEYETKSIDSYQNEIGTKITRNMCVDILERGDSSGDGVYKVDPDGVGGVGARDAYCDMSGGGWTLYDSFGTKLLKTGEDNPASFNARSINSFATLSNAGYSSVITLINYTPYATSPYYMQFMYGGDPNGYIQKDMPDWVKGIRVSTTNEWYGRTSYTTVGSRTIPKGGYTGHQYLDFAPGKRMAMVETGIYWVESVWVK